MDLLVILLIVLLVLFVIGGVALSPLLWVAVAIVLCFLLFLFSRGRRGGA